MLRIHAAATSSAPPHPRPPSLLQEFLAIQNEQPRNVGFFGTRNMGFMHQQLIEVLSYAMLLTVSPLPCLCVCVCAQGAGPLRPLLACVTVCMCVRRRVGAGGCASWLTCLRTEPAARERCRSCRHRQGWMHCTVDQPAARAWQTW